MFTAPLARFRWVLALATIGLASAAAWGAWSYASGKRLYREQAVHDAGVMQALVQEHEGDMRKVASRAVSVPPLREAFATGVDGITLTDLLESEDWWAPFRPYGVAIIQDGKALTTKEQGVPLPASSPLVAAALTNDFAFALQGAGDAFEVAAKRSRDGGRHVLLLSRRSTLPAKRRELEQARAGLMRPSLPVWLTGLLGGLGVICAVVTALVWRPRSVAPSPVLPVMVTASPPTVAPVPAPTAPQATAFGSQSAQMFGRYTLLERIGEGGMAEIYAAVLSGAEGFSRYYVVKRLRPELAQNKAAVEQFIDEAKLGSQLVHSNIVPVFDFGRVGNGYFIAQEYIMGRNLNEVMQRHHDRLGQPLPAALACYVAHEALEALAYAHDKTDDNGVPLGIVHRDVSTSNVMVSLQGEVKLLDFGIVKASSRISRTDLGNVKGNASFMSPEQARGQEVDKRSDLFSMGVVLYYLLTGAQLYPGETTAEVFYKATTGPTADHFASLRSLPSPLGEIVTCALSLDPAARFADAQAFADVLAPFTAGARVELATLMNALFGDELRRKTSEFRQPLFSVPPSIG